MLCWIGCATSGAYWRAYSTQSRFKKSCLVTRLRPCALCASCLRAACFHAHHMLIRHFLLHLHRHPNIVSIIGVVLDHSDWVCLLMELAELGSLRQLLDTSPDKVVGQAPVQLALALDVALGLAFLHAQEPKAVLHRDVKSANVLLFLKDGLMMAKVADFGLASGLHGTSLASTVRGVGGLTGTYAYMAPEAWDSAYSTRSDVYSFGLVLWELLTGERPWRKDEEGREINHPGELRACQPYLRTP